MSERDEDEEDFFAMAWFRAKLDAGLISLWPETAAAEMRARGANMGAEDEVPPPSTDADGGVTT